MTCMYQPRFQSISETRVSTRHSTVSRHAALDNITCLYKQDYYLPLILIEPTSSCISNSWEKKIETLIIKFKVNERSFRYMKNNSKGEKESFFKNNCIIQAVIKLFNLSDLPTADFLKDKNLKDVCKKGESLIFTLGKQMGKCPFCNIKNTRNVVSKRTCITCKWNKESFVSNSISSALYHPSFLTEVIPTKRSGSNAIENFLCLELLSRGKENWTNVLNHFLVGRLNTRLVTMIIIVNIKCSTRDFYPPLFITKNFYSTLVHDIKGDKSAFVFIKYENNDLNLRKLICHTLNALFTCAKTYTTYLNTIYEMCDIDKEQLQLDKRNISSLYEIVFKKLLCYISSPISNSLSTETRSKNLRRLKSYIFDNLPHLISLHLLDIVNNCFTIPDVHKFCNALLDIPDGTMTVPRYTSTCFRNIFLRD